MLTVREALNQAVALHRRGELDQAEQLYRQILEADARNPDAWNLLGLVAHARGKHAEAAEFISRAIKLDGSQPSFQFHLAEAYRAAGRLDLAEQCCRQALRMKPDYATAYNTLGLLQSQQGQLETAVESYRSAIAIDPNFALAHGNLGATLHGLGQMDEAAASCHRALELDPAQIGAGIELSKILRDQDETAAAMETIRRVLSLAPRAVEAEFVLGTLWQQQKQPHEAAATYRRALAIDPRHAPSHCNLGSVLRELGQPAEAFAEYQLAVQCEPQLAEAHFNLGVMLHKQGRDDDAIRAYESATAARGDYAQAHNNLGTLYKSKGDWQRASECYAKALEVLPNSAEALNNVGNLLKVQGRLDEARICYEQTLRIAPDYAQVHYNLGLMHLADGDFARGWPEYEWRLKCMDVAQRTFDQPRWNGEVLPEATLLVHAEQGLGDTLQFVRYLPLVAQRVGRVLCEVQPALLPLLKQSGCDAHAVLLAKGEPLPPFDAHVPLLSLPGAMGTTLDNVPRPARYLAADADRVARWRNVLTQSAGSEKVFRIGIAWQGSATYWGDRERSIPLVEFAPLALPGVELVSLQKGFGTEQIAALDGNFAVRELGPEFDSSGGAFLDAAAVIENVDLVITSDTAIAHLAGALGKETWLALGLVPDWRWMFEREDSPWYPSMRLFRQARVGEWGEVFARMAEMLGARVQ
jgi:tetratricopeptide (TPR) repeat protein